MPAVWASWRRRAADVADFSDGRSDRHQPGGRHQERLHLHDWQLLGNAGDQLQYHGRSGHPRDHRTALLLQRQLRRDSVLRIDHHHLRNQHYADLTIFQDFPLAAGNESKHSRSFFLPPKLPLVVNIAFPVPCHSASLRGGTPWHGISPQSPSCSCHSGRSRRHGKATHSGKRRFFGPPAPDQLNFLAFLASDRRRVVRYEVRCKTLMAGELPLLTW